MKSRVIYLNGQLVPENERHISALDRGFTLGDGVFDTLRAVNGHIFRLDDHLERLDRAAKTIGLELPVEPSVLTGGIAYLLEANGLADALIRITISRGIPARRGLLPPEIPSPCVAIAATPFVGYPEEWYENGYRAVISKVRRNETSPLSRIKSCNYLDSVLARMEASAQGADEALFLNVSGELVCGTSSNVFIVQDGNLATPHLESGILDGITRRTVLGIAQRLGIHCTQRAVHLDEVCRSQEAFITNTAIGIMPLVALNGYPIGSGVPGPVTQGLRKAYNGVLYCSGPTTKR